MAIDYTTLFTNLGKLGKALKNADSYADGTLKVDLNAIVSTFGVTYAAQSAPVSTDIVGIQSPTYSPLGATLQSVAGAILCKLVNADTQLASSTDVPLALAELVRQMKGASGATVKQAAVTCTVAADSANVGTGVVVASAKRGDGLIQQNAFAETAVLTCVNDSQVGTATAGAESLVFAGDEAPAGGVFSPEWPGASGARATLTVVDSQQSNNRNLLTNSDFETFTVANTPDSWTIATGSAGTTVFQEASVVYRGTGALRFLGNGSQLTSVTQTFTTPTGTAGQTGGVLRPNKVYALSVAVRVSAAVSSGVLEFALVDGSGTIVTDDQSSGGFLSIDLTTLATPTVYTTGPGFSIVIITPKNLPTGLRLRIKLTTALENGKSVYIDSLALAEMTSLYPGGPFLAAFAGATPFLTGDFWTVTAANNRGGRTYGTTFQAFFDRMFGMRALGLILRYSASPSMADSLFD